MFNPRSIFSKGKGVSRRQALKNAIFAGAGLAIGGSTSLAAAETSTPSGLVLPQSSAPAANEVKPESVPNANYNYKIYTGPDFQPTDANVSYHLQDQTGIYFNGPLDGYYTFYLSLDLPQHAKLTQIEFYTRSSGGSSSVGLAVIYPSNGGITNLNSVGIPNYNVVSTVDLGDLSSVAKSDNTLFKYILVWKAAILGSVSDYLYGARVGYSGGTVHYGG